MNHPNQYQPQQFAQQPQQFVQQQAPQQAPMSYPMQQAPQQAPMGYPMQQAPQQAPMGYPMQQAPLQAPMGYPMQAAPAAGYPMQGAPVGGMPNIPGLNPQLAAQLAAAGQALGGASSFMDGQDIGGSVNRLRINERGFVVFTINGADSPPQPNAFVAIGGVYPERFRSTRRMFWAKAFNKNDQPTDPDCFSEDGTAPDAASKTPQGRDCKTCPQNQPNSNPQGGKACRFAKTLLLFRVNPTGPGTWQVDPTPFAYSAPATSLFSEYDPETGSMGLFAVGQLLAQGNLNALEAAVLEVGAFKGTQAGALFRVAGVDISMHGAVTQFARHPDAQRILTPINRAPAAPANPALPAAQQAPALAAPQQMAQPQMQPQYQQPEQQPMAQPQMQPQYQQPEQQPMGHPQMQPQYQQPVQQPMAQPQMQPQYQPPVQQPMAQPQMQPQMQPQYQPQPAAAQQMPDPAMQQAMSGHAYSGAPAQQAAPALPGGFSQTPPVQLPGAAVPHASAAVAAFGGFGTPAATR